MFRITVIAALFTMSVAACKPKQQGNLKIHVDLKNNPVKQTVYLVAKEYGSPQLVIDTIVIGPGDVKFDFAAYATHEGIYRLKFEQNGNFIWLTNDMKDINVNADWKDFGLYNVQTPGSSSLKNLLKTFNDSLVVIDSIKHLAQEMDPADSQFKKTTQNYEAKVNNAVSYVLKYADTTASAGVAIYAMGILQQKQPDTAELKPVISRLNDRFASNAEIRKISAGYFDYIRKLTSTYLVGRDAPEFSLPDTSGKAVPLKSFRGKYLLVDFWASWCTPCRHENPNVVKAFKTYRNKNFTILGVSLDKERSEWVNAIQEDKLNWNHVSDLKEWHSDVLKLYSIEGIPFNVLIDPQGKIIGQNLRGKGLQDTLARFLK